MVGRYRQHRFCCTKFCRKFFLTLKWNDKRLAHNDKSAHIFNVVDVWTPNLQIVNEIGRVRTTLPEIVRVKNDGTVIYRQRYVGSFSQALNLYKFPFDEQLFRLHLIRTGNLDMEVKFVQDDELIALGLDQAAGISKDISLPAWTVESYKTSSLPYIVSPQMH